MCGHGEFLSVACEVSCRVRAGDARPCASSRRSLCVPRPLGVLRVASPRAGPKGVFGPTAYLGPPLLPCVDEWWWVGSPGRRQDSAVRPDEV
ncbi:hypothetical protein SBD_4673 [Streptomyces bottropensis ATCC 25435]|uniref:Uncharacterized protein n=1 Tax=Streptomyces bottropensis ATCC 25435 TaxID=1054862 RepID=M3FS39_9ACTN|nr:hypothetical protein SBD_4673 [Streptomyces bottropensis ATCC 25435]